MKSAAADPALLGPAAAACAVALGYALEISNGHVGNGSIAWLTVALLSIATGLFVRIRSVDFLPSIEIATRIFLGVALLFQLFQMGSHLPAIHLVATDDNTLLPYRAGVALAALFSLGLLSRRARIQQASFIALIAIFLFLGVWLIRTSPDPLIDVYKIHRASLNALLRGENPYTLTFPNPYPTTIMYGPGQVENGRLNFGYCYPPLTLIFALPGHLLGGDYRYSQLVAMALTAALLGSCGPGRRPRLAAAVLLFTPRVFYVLEQGWTDPFVALLVAVVVFAACRAPRLLPYSIGLFLVSKQYTFIAIPLIAWLLFAHPRDCLKPRFLLRMLVPAAVLTLPLALWNFRGFLWSCLVLQFSSPFRRDALSYLAFVVLKGGPQLSAAAGFIAVIPATLLCLLRAPRTPAGFAASMAFAYGLFFSLNKQAFSNYYYLVIACACAACAATTSRLRDA